MTYGGLPSSQLPQRLQYRSIADLAMETPSIADPAECGDATSDAISIPLPKPISLRMPVIVFRHQPTPFDARRPETNANPRTSNAAGVISRSVIAFILNSISPEKAERFNSSEGKGASVVAPSHDCAAFTLHLNEPGNSAPFVSKSFSPVNHMIVGAL